MIISLDDLPDEPQAALFAHTRRAAERLGLDLDELMVSTGFDLNTARKIGLLEGYVRAFVDEYDDLQIELPQQERDQDGDPYPYWALEFVHTFAIQLTRGAIRKSKMEHLGAAMPEEARDQLRHLVARLRDVVQNASAPDYRKRALLRRISELEQEFERDRTRVAVVKDLWFEATSAIGKGAENLEPAVELIERIGRIVGKFSDVKLLPAPPKQLPKPSKTAAESEVDGDPAF
jgi:hypothetical protein